ncbi:MAG: Cu/Ag efflux pump CusA [Neolewinella sp.]|jgi:Cu/Ag efflux pump CusA
MKTFSFHHKLLLMAGLLLSLHSLVPHVHGAQFVTTEELTLEASLPEGVSIYPYLDRMAQYGINVREANQLIRAAYAGEVVGNVYEEERRFDLVVRLNDQSRQQLNLDQLSITARNGQLIPLSEVASVEERESPMLISREQARRFINIGVNIRNRDVTSLVADIQSALTAELNLPHYRCRRYPSAARADDRRRGCFRFPAHGAFQR